ncbi:MAG: hypothetical protein V4558_01845 [Gemmatimonadota bacterium]
MTDSPHVSPNPFGDAAPKEDRVGLAANAMASGMAIAVASIALVAWGTTRAAANSGITSKETITDGFAVNLVIYGTLGSIFLAGVVAWGLMATVDSNYRRGGLSMVSAFAGFLLSVLLTMLVRGLLGVAALPVLAGIAALVATFFIRRARAAV